MSTRDDLGQLAAEYLALQQTLDAQPQTVDPVTGHSVSSTRLVGVALLYGMRTARAYVTDPAPFWLAGVGLGLVLVLVVFFAVRGFAQ